jgi:hypothetical protein
VAGMKDSGENEALITSTGTNPKEKDKPGV